MGKISNNNSLSSLSSNAGSGAKLDIVGQLNEEGCSPHFGITHHGSDGSPQFELKEENSLSLGGGHTDSSFEKNNKDHSIVKLEDRKFSKDEVLRKKSLSSVMTT